MLLYKLYTNDSRCFQNPLYSQKYISEHDTLPKFHKNKIIHTFCLPIPNDRPLDGHLQLQPPLARQVETSSTSQRMFRPIILLMVQKSGETTTISTGESPENLPLFTVFSFFTSLPTQGPELWSRSGGYTSLLNHGGFNANGHNPEMHRHSFGVGGQEKWPIGLLGDL